MDDPTLTLSEVTELVTGRLEGDGAREIRGVAPLADADQDQLGLLADRRYLDLLPDSRAGALLVASELAHDVPAERARIVVDDAHAALIPLLEHFHPPRQPEPGIHPTAVLGPGVELGTDVRIGPYAVVEAGSVLGDRVEIGPHAVVARGSRIGEDTVVHAHAVLYPGTVLGRRVIVHAGAKLGVDGFGYAREDDAFRKVPQVGGCVVEDDVEIGANSCVDRGSIGETRLGQGTKIDNLVQLAHNVRIGAHCAMAAQVGIAGSTRVGSGVFFGGQAGLAGHLHIGDGARISAQAGVIGDVEAEASVTGYPARDLRTYMKASAHFLRLPELAGRVKALETAVERLVEGSEESG